MDVCYVKDITMNTSIKCSRCTRKNLTEKDFYKRKSRERGFDYFCKKCAKKRTDKYTKENPEKRKSTVQNWKKKQPREKFRAYERKIIDKLIQIIKEAKSVPCMDCGVGYPSYVMDFDHRDPTEKIACVSELIKKKSERIIRNEIAKCDVVCSNCHRQRTHSSN